jgi:para-nitrobenzyl esterase
MALDEAGLKAKVGKRLGMDPTEVIATYKKMHPDATPWDLSILIATDHPRGIYTRELAKRKAAQKSAAAYVYRFDWETPENGGHMRSPHTIEIQFAFHNISIAGPLISKMPEAYALEEKVSAVWAAFARTGNPNTAGVPKWPAYSAEKRDTMLFNNTLKVEQDPERETRVLMEKVLKLA